MGKIVKNYESFKTGDATNEEFVFKALGNLFKGIFKRLNDKITKLGEDFAAQKKLIKTDILNPKSTDSLLAPLFKEYNAKPQFNDQDCFDLVGKLVDPDDGVLSQVAIQGFVADFKNENDKKAWTYILEKMRNNMMVFLNYGGQVAKNFKVGQPLPKPALKPEAKSGKAIQRTADGKNFVEVIHLPLLKKLIAPLTDDKKKVAVINWINTTVLPQMFKFSDALNEQEVDGFSGEGKEALVLGWKDIEVELKLPVKGKTTRYEIIRSNSKKLVVSQGKTVFCDITGDAKKGASVTFSNLTLSTADGQAFEIDGKAEYATGNLEEIVLNGKAVENYKFEAVEGKPGEAVAMDYQKLIDIYDKQEEVIFLLPGIEKEKYDATKSPDEQKDVVGVAKMKALNDQNNEESVTFDYDGKEIKMGYAQIIGPLTKEQAAEEADSAKTALAEIKDDEVKMKKVTNYAEFLKKAKEDEIQTIGDLIDDELKKLG